MYLSYDFKDDKINDLFKEANLKSNNILFAVIEIHIY